LAQNHRIGYNVFSGIGYFFTRSWQIADVLRNNVAYGNGEFWETNDDHTNWVESNNAWDDGGRYSPPNPVIDVTDADFVSLDTSELV
jgi:hypothetical protein